MRALWLWNDVQHVSVHQLSQSPPDVGVVRVDAASNIAWAEAELWPVRDVGQDFAGCGCHFVSSVVVITGAAPLASVVHC